jgi:hypothetical protein
MWSLRTRHQVLQVSNIYDVTNWGAVPVDVIWRVLEFSLLPSSALKFYHGMPTFVPRNANFRTAECQGLKTVARFVAFRGKFMSGTVRSVAFRGQNLTKELAFRSILASGGWHSSDFWAQNAKGLRRSRGLWHSAEIWARNLAKDWIPVPAILHRQIPCLLCHNFLTHDFLAVKPWRGKLFRPKLSTQGLIWNSISWHYTFNVMLNVSFLLF